MTQEEEIVVEVLDQQNVATRFIHFVSCTGNVMLSGVAPKWGQDRRAREFWTGFQTGETKEILAVLTVLSVECWNSGGWSLSVLYGKMAKGTGRWELQRSPGVRGSRGKCACRGLRGAADCSCQGPWNVDLRTPPGQECSNGSLLCIRRGHPGISFSIFGLRFGGRSRKIQTHDQSKMSYQVIARKYRPQRFADVVGQEHVTQTLSNAIEQNRIAHAYLFVGPRGTGKTTIARIFAKCLNCTGGPKVDFADDDPKCVEITEGRSMDVLEIDGASNRGIEEIRELRETVKYVPATSKFKIYIIDEVHMLTKEAFNALLKTLEEPPGHVKFMFATTEPEKVLPTILSRCQRFDLRRIPSALITKHLAHIAKLEKVKIDAAALDAIARGAEGGMRDAESTLDQLISFCGDKIEEADVLSMFGLTARDQILKLAHSVLAGETETALRELNELAKQGKDLGRLVSDLLGHFRNLLIYRVSRGDLGMLAEQSAVLSPDALTRVMEVFSECEMRLRDAASKKILIEVALLKAIEARNA